MDHRLSTSFHPQTDGQTERQNQTMEQYLRAYVSYEQNDWVELLPLAQFAYNNSRHASTRMTPFFSMYGMHPRMHSVLPTVRGTRRILPSERAADNYAIKLEELRERLKRNILDAQERQSKYAKGKEMTFNIGDKVWLSTKHIKTARLSKKLDYKRIGPYTVSKVVNKNAYKLELPHTLRIHNVFHVSLLDVYRPPVIGQPPAEPLPAISADDPEMEEYEVERILDSRARGRGRKRRIEYLVQWAGYAYISTTWEPSEKVENCAELVDEFHAANPSKPRPPRN
jgi:hypothetical protein